MGNITFKVFREGEIKKTLENQDSDLNLLGFMLRSQSQSMSWAVKYEGWKIYSISDGEIHKMVTTGPLDHIDWKLVDEIKEES